MSYKFIKRKNETAQSLHRKFYEQTPDGLNSKEWKKFRKQYNDAANLKINLNPAQIDIELNSNCNHHCAFCIHGITKRKMSSLTFDQFIFVIEQAIKFGTRSLKLNYLNEPLLVKDLERYIEFAKEKGMINISLSTNAVLLTPSRSKSLIESGLTKIFVSIDAVKAETYNALRNSNGFDKIIENTENFIKIRNEMGLRYPVVRVNFLRTAINKDEEQLFVDYWKDKADMVIVQKMNEILDVHTGLTIKEPEKEFHCSFPFKQIVITSEGDILPCCTMYGLRHKIGNISDITLKEAWNSDKIKYLREIHKNGDYKIDPICKRCTDGD
jgi:radical SAM protein with 4Fe4S-binding SPASM domain